jgi:ATP-dependent protease ClpP protease subunit
MNSLCLGMAKDILLMGNIGQYNALYFFEQIKEALKDSPGEDLIMRVNTEGGSPDYMMSIMEKVQELADQITIKGGSQMHSAGFFSMCYVPAERVEATDVTQAVLHRAAYPSWMESSSEFKGSIYDLTLAKTNKDLEKAVRARVDIDVLESLPQFKEKNIKLKDVFSTDSRIDVLLTASDLKKIGLVSKINKITPSKQAELQAEIELFKQCNSLDELRTAASLVSTDKPEKKVQQTNNNNNTEMNLEELKSQHPELYAKVLAEGKSSGLQEGSQAERIRVQSWEAFRSVDPEAVNKGINEGKVLTPADQSEFLVKMANPDRLKKLAESAPPVVETKPEDSKVKTEKEKNMADFMAEVNANLGRKTEVKS